jgi:hypothetical protein
MPSMMVSLVSSSTKARKVGSSLLKRLRALDMLIWLLLSLGTMAKEMTGLGTNIEVIERFRPGALKVSPEAQSTPKRAPI